MTENALNIKDRQRLSNRVLFYRISRIPLSPSVMNNNTTLPHFFDLDRGAQQQISLAFGAIMAGLGLITTIVALLAFWFQHREKTTRGTSFSKL